MKPFLVILIITKPLGFNWFLLFGQVLGKLVAPETPEAWKECESDVWLSFTDVHNLTVNGSGQIDGRGSSWWSKAEHQRLYIDEKHKNDDEVVKCHRPKALHFQGCHNLLLTGITHVNSPKAHISISNCRYVYVANLTITAPEDSPNTDGIDISNTNYVNIHSSYIGTGNLVYLVIISIFLLQCKPSVILIREPTTIFCFPTGDDCIAINSGCSNLNITNIKCGPGHGIRFVPYFTETFKIIEWYFMHVLKLTLCQR